MARDPGEWYEEKRREAERLAHELAGARAVLEALAAVDCWPPAPTCGEHPVEVARAVVRRLERQLEAARYVGD